MRRLIFDRGSGELRDALPQTPFNNTGKRALVAPAASAELEHRRQSHETKAD